MALSIDARNIALSTDARMPLDGEDGRSTRQGESNSRQRLKFCVSMAFTFGASMLLGFFIVGPAAKHAVIDSEGNSRDMDGFLAKRLEVPRGAARRSGASTMVQREPQTGMTFPLKKGSTTLHATGVRKKGPIKVYAVGEYADGEFLIKMTYGVSAAKMGNAFADALKSRFSDEKLISDFKDSLIRGLPNGAPKGSEMLFRTGNGMLIAEVNGKKVASIPSKGMATAFANIYRDRNAVCKMSVVENKGK